MSRRSSRRLTITGSSVFAASTPVIPQAVKKQNDSDSPKWVSADEFLSFKTPKFPKMSRRTTLTRQDITEKTISEEPDFKGKGFKIPMFIPISPPGVKTRSRRSSMYVAKQKTQSNNNNNNNNNKVARKNFPTKGSKVVDAKRKMPDLKSDKPVIKPRKSIAPTGKAWSSSPNEENVASLTHLKKPGEKRTNNDMENKFIAVELERLPSQEDSDVTTCLKRPRKSGIQPLKALEIESTANSATSVQDFQTPKSRSQIKKDSQESVQVEKLEQQNKIKTPMAQSSQMTCEVSKVQRSPVEQYLSPPPVKSAARSRGKAQVVSKPTENEDTFDYEIDKVVKKMFSPGSFYSASSLTKKQKYTSPNTGKSFASPARAALQKETLSSAHKSKILSPGRRLGEASPAQKTPSRAAPKARKLLGVSTPSHVSVQQNEELVEERKERLAESFHIHEEVETSMSTVDENISFVSENEQNLTLSHTSHSQWCNIL